MQKEPRKTQKAQKDPLCFCAFSWLISSGAVDQEEHDCFLRVKSVLCLVVDDRTFVVDHFRIDLVSPVRRQAVHEECASGSGRHKLPRDTEWSEDLSPPLSLRLEAHRGPHVSIDSLCVLDRFLRIVYNLDSGARRPSGAASHSEDL